jgi:hypothetical protein
LKTSGLIFENKILLILENQQMTAHFVLTFTVIDQQKIDISDEEF